MIITSPIKLLLISVLVCCLISPDSFAQEPILKHSYTFDNGTAADVVGNADGLIQGGKIEDGKYITSEEGQHIQLPAKSIDLKSYTSLTLEAYIIAGKGNAINTQLSYFGNETESLGIDYIFLSPRNRGFTRSGISCKNQTSPWLSGTFTRCNPVDDGLPHHIVTTFDNKTLKLYVDGLLVDSQTNEEFPDNILVNIGDELAYLAKSGYSNDPTWLGSIDAFNIYEGILDSATIDKSARDYLPEKVIAVRNQLTNLNPPEGLINQTRLDTLKYGISLNNDWKYYSGDDPAWAGKNFDDSSWPIIVSNNLNADSINGKPWEGIGWFRREIIIDSTLYNKAVAIMMNQRAASEIYLNGQLIQSNGQIGSDTIDEKLYNPKYIPFVTVFDSSSIQVIAIRYSNQKALQNYKRYGKSAKYIGFSIRIGKTDKLIDSSFEDTILNGALFTTFAVSFLAFTLLNLLMFFFYSKGKENFYFALYTGSATLVFGYIIYSNIVRQISAMSYISELIALMVVPLLFASYVFFLYTIFYNKRPRQFWAIVIVGTLISISILTPLRSRFDFKYIIFPFITLLTLEGLRVTIQAIWRKKRNAVIIGTGVAIFSISVSFITVVMLGQSNLPDILGITIVFSAVFSLPLTMLIYLSRERAKTKLDLENQIVQVQKLSVKAIEQEKREAELKIENARKEVELQKTAELKSAYENLEIAHENLKSTQSQLIQSEKMASLGELTAGIAHEIQNPLNFVNNFSEVSNELIVEVEEERAKNPESRDENLVSGILTDIKQNLEKINHHGKRADAIVKGMLQHSRTSTGQKELTDINALADEYLRLAYHGLRAKDKSFNADFKTEFDESLPKINVIPQDIGRVLLNLINNAFYAVDKRAKSIDPLTPEGGNKNHQIKYEPTVTVSTASFIPPSGGPRGVRISVKDNGDGINKNILDKIFQPFFTTKPTGSGTGLGLSLSYDIVKAHGGEIKVESLSADEAGKENIGLPEEQVGTQFTITLPI